MIALARTTRIVRRPVFASVSIEVIVKAVPFTISVKFWSITFTWGYFGRCQSTCTGVSHYLTFTTLQLTSPSCQSTKLPVPGWHTSQLFMLLLIRICLPSSFQSEKFMALKFVSFKGGVVDIGTFTSGVTCQLGLGVTAFEWAVKSTLLVKE